MDVSKGSDYRLSEIEAIRKDIDAIETKGFKLKVTSSNGKKVDVTKEELTRLKLLLSIHERSPA